MKSELTLIVDQDDISSIIVQLYTQRFDFFGTSTILPSTISALDYLDQNKSDHNKWPDLIILELQAHVIDGFEFLDHFRNIKTDYLEKTAICATSTCEKCEKIDKLISKREIIHYMQKPYSFGGFEQLIQQYCNR